MNKGIPISLSADELLVVIEALENASAIDTVDDAERRKSAHVAAELTEKLSHIYAKWMQR